MRCSNCNAPIQDDVEECNFCGTVTELGRKARSARSQQQAADQREAARRAEAQAAANRARELTEARQSANRSLMWSLFGLLACCLPLGPLVGFAMARRARDLAIQNKVPTGHATGAYVTSIVAALFSIGCWIGVAFIIQAEAKRKTELKALIAKGDADPVLSSATACAMTELELLGTQYEGFDNLNAELTCGTSVVIEGKEARFASHFAKSQKRVEVVACFHRGDRWAVTQVRGDERCDQPPPPPREK